MRILAAIGALAIALVTALSIIGDGQAAPSPASSTTAAVATAAHHKCHHHRHHCTRRHPCVNPGGPNLPV